MITKMKNKKRESRLFIKNKQGQGHIEMILSFIIFIGFLLAIFIFLNPFAKKEPDMSIDRIQQSIMDYISDDVGKLSIIIANPANCYYFKVSDYEGNYLEIQDNPLELRKFTIYFNDIFSNSAPKRSDPCVDAYTLGTYSKENMVIYEKIQELRTNYLDNYEDLKTSLSILDEFKFELKKVGGGVEISVEKDIPYGIKVKATTIPIRTINVNGEISQYILNIRAW